MPLITFKVKTASYFSSKRCVCLDVKENCIPSINKLCPDRRQVWGMNERQAFSKRRVVSWEGSYEGKVHLRVN